VPPNERDRDALERRLDAVERALADDAPLEGVDRLDDLETRIAELEAAVQALRGYVGSVRAVNEDVERRADRAFRKARAVERVVAPAPADSDGGSDAGVGPDPDSNPTSAPDSDRPGEGSDDHALARLRRRL
jgi:uncharacterized coiled-coil protein SlyX